MVGDVLEHIGAGDDADDRAVALHQHRGAPEASIGTTRSTSSLASTSGKGPSMTVLIGAQRIGIAEELIEQTLLHGPRHGLDLDACGDPSSP